MSHQVHLVREGACTATDVHALVARVVDAERDIRTRLSVEALEGLRAAGARGNDTATSVVKRYFVCVSAAADAWDKLHRRCSKHLVAYREDVTGLHAKAESDREADEHAMGSSVDGLRHAQSGDELEVAFKKVKVKLDEVRCVCLLTQFRCVSF
jgi:hypothetical protein